MNFLMASISPNSNPEESALPKSLIGFNHLIEIWLAEVTRVSRPPVVPRGNNFAKRKGGPRNAVQLVILSNVQVHMFEFEGSLIGRKRWPLDGASSIVAMGGRKVSGPKTVTIND
jgi:hypothetical protein